jgi:hypothetical protein
MSTVVFLTAGCLHTTRAGASSRSHPSEDIKASNGGRAVNSLGGLAHAIEYAVLGTSTTRHPSHRGAAVEEKAEDGAEWGHTAHGAGSPSRMPLTRIRLSRAAPGSPAGRLGKAASTAPRVIASAATPNALKRQVFSR